QPVFELDGTGRHLDGCAPRARARRTVRLPFQYAADPAHAGNTFGLHRAGLHAIDPLRRALEETALVADDGRSRLEAAAVIDFLSIGFGKGSEIAAVERGPGGDLAGNESGSALLDRRSGRIRSGRLVGGGRHAEKGEARPRALRDPVRRAD